MQRQGKLHSRSDIFWLLLIVLVGSWPRANLLYLSGGIVDADEAIVGLMAKHILEGQSWPVFFYGQHYMGSLEAILAACSFMLFGISSFALKLVPFIFSLFHIVLVYMLTRRFSDSFGARLAAALTALGPSALILWSTKARGGFIELVVIGTLALLITCDVLQASRSSKMRVFLLGLVLGFGWWVNNQILFYMVPVAVVCAVHWLRQSGVWHCLALGAVALISFILGGIPFWWINFVQKPPFQSFSIFETAGASQMLQHLHGFISEALPIIFGARRFWSVRDVFSGSSALTFAVYTVILLLIVFLWISGFRERAKQNKASFGSGVSGNTGVVTGPTGNAQFGLLLLFCLTVPLIFSASQFGWLSQAPRYLLPLYSVIFVLVGTAVSFLRKAGNSFAVRNWFSVTPAGLAAVAIALVLFVTQMSANYVFGVSELPGQPFVCEEVCKTDRVATDHRKLYRWLKINNYRHIKTSYWIGYRVAFETKEKITFSRFGDPRSIRIPQYEALADGYQPYVPYILSPHQAVLVQAGLKNLGFNFRTTKIGSYVAVDRIEPDTVIEERVPIQPDQITVSSRQSWGKQMVDGSLGTRWGSGTPQSPGMAILIDLTNPITIVGIDLDFGFWRQDTPRNLIIEGLVSGVNANKSTWCTLFDMSDSRALGYMMEGERRWRIRFVPERKINRLRLVQTASARVVDWSVAELEIYQKAEQKVE